MALKFDKYLFYHIPKTGGTYVREVLKLISNDFKEVGHTHNTPLEVENYEKIPSFTIVRHPLDWYKSYYRYRIVSGWRKGHFIDKHAQSESFDGFMNNFLKAYPCGYVTSRYLSVVPFVPNILRTETLDRDLKQLLKNWGYGFPKAKRRNVTPKTIDTSISDATKAKLFRVESRAISYLGY